MDKQFDETVYNESISDFASFDFSGYPDCRDDTIKAMQLALSLGMDKRFLIALVPRKRATATGRKCGSCSKACDPRGYPS